MPQNNSALPTLPEQAARLALVDKAVARRIDEARELESRLALRVDFLVKAEENLKNLLDNLRKNTTELAPIIAQIPHLRENASVVVADLVQEARVQVSRLIEPVQHKILSATETAQQTLLETSEQLQTQARSAIVQHVAEAAGQTKDALIDHAKQVEADLTTTSQTLAAYIDNEMNKVREESDRIADQIRTCVHQARDLATELSDGVESRLQQSLERAKTQANTLTEPMRRQLNEDLRAHEGRVEQLIAAADSQLSGKATQLERTLSLAMTQIDVQIRAAEEQVQTHAAQSITNVKRGLQQQIDSLAQQAKIDIRPILSQIDDARETFERQVAALCQSVESNLRGRVVELRSTGEQTVDLVEQQLIARLRGLRPQAQVMLDQTQEAIEQRIGTLLQSATTRIEQGESQLVMKIEDLRPRCASLVRDVEAEVNGHLKRWEQESRTLTHGLEHRLAERIEQLVDTSRGKLGGEIERIDDAAAKLARLRLRATPRQSDTPAEPVQVHLPQRQSQHLAA